MNVSYREKNGKIQAIISYKCNGKWKQKTKQGFDKKSDAKKWAKEMQFELIEMEKLNLNTEDTSLGEVIEEYIQMLKLRNVSDNTIIAYNTLYNFIKDIQDVPIKNLSSYDVEVFFLKKSEITGHSYSEYLRYLKIIFNFACNDLKLIPDNTIRKLKIKKKTDERIKFIDKELYEEILNNVPAEYRLLLKIAYNTGLRIGEISGLTIKDISPHEIDVNKQWSNGKFHKLKTKNSYRKVPISIDLYNELKSCTIDIHGRMFYNVKRNNVNYYLQDFNTSLHCFRHTYITRLVSEGIATKLISKITGDTVEMIYKVYLELNKDTSEEEINQIRQMIN